MAETEQTKPILLVLTDGEPTSTAVGQAIARSEQLSAPLLILYVHDPDVTRSFEQIAMAGGFLGERVGEIVHEALTEDAQIRAEDALDRVRALCKRVDLEPEILARQGRLADIVLGLIGERGPSHVFISRRRRSVLNRLVFGCPVRDLRRVTKIPVEVIYEE